MDDMHLPQKSGDKTEKKSNALMYIITAAALAAVVLVSAFAIIITDKNAGKKATESVLSSIELQSVSFSDLISDTDESEVSSRNSETASFADFTVTDLSATMYAAISLNVRDYPGTDGKVIGNYKKNAQVPVTGKCQNGWYRVGYNNTVGYCSGKYLRDSEIPTQASAEAPYQAPANADLTKPYYLKINLTQNIVTAYGKDEKGEFTVPVKAMYCSTGLSGKTPAGTFNTTNKYRWKILSGDVYGQYCTRITGHILFHSVPYNTQNNSDLNYNKYNKLGSAASAGCVRLSTADAKWIYDNCPSGTTVTTYRSSEPEPITPPPPIRIDVNDPRRGWDPTDPDPNNPWLAQ